MCATIIYNMQYDLVCTGGSAACVPTGTATYISHRAD
jgi:hypothetical protein